MAGRIVKHVKKALSVKPETKWAEEKTKLDAVREQHGSNCVLDDDPDYEEIRNNARIKSETRRAPHQPSERFNLRATLCMCLVYN